MKKKKKPLSPKSGLGNQETPTKPESTESKPVSIENLEQYWKYKKAKTDSYAATYKDKIIDLGKTELDSEKAVFESLYWNTEFAIFNLEGSEGSRLRNFEEITKKLEEMIKTGEVKIVRITTHYKVL